GHRLRPRFAGGRRGSSQQGLPRNSPPRGDPPRVGSVAGSLAAAHDLERRDPAHPRRRPRRARRARGDHADRLNGKGKDNKMSAIATSAKLPALGAQQRDEVGRELQGTLVELVDLALIGKQLHWTVVGLNFRPLHLHLDELVDSWRELSDTVAERAVAIGFMPDGQAKAVETDSKLGPVERTALEDHVVVRELTHRVADVSERVRSRMDRLGEIDLASQDVLIEVVRALEEQQWMLRAQLGPSA